MSSNKIKFFARIFPLFFIFLFTCLVSCREKCDDFRENFIRVQFFRLATLEDTIVTFNRIEGFGATIIADNPVLFDDTDTTLSTFALPASSSQNQVAFAFERTGLMDTLILSYDRQLGVISPNCGINERLFNLQVQKHTFDSLALINTQIENESVHVEIYLTD